MQQQMIWMEECQQQIIKEMDLEKLTGPGKLTTFIKQEPGANLCCQQIEKIIVNIALKDKPIYPKEKKGATITATA